jgi:dTDP-4-amino-4,6-dideoxygalactose transaminase/SAM-dependent methyltransferase
MRPESRERQKLEDNASVSELARLEEEFCSYTGHKYAVGVNSCGSAMFLTLKAVGVRQGDKIFTNSFTFTAVPSSIVHAGGVPVYVECDRRYIIDSDDFEEKIRSNPDVKYFLLSYMRGHISDLDRIKQLCDAAGICLIEDCAHALGARWYDEQSGEYRHVGHHGRAACFSTQSYKMLNSGEGGFVVTDDREIAAYCILGAGSYEKLYSHHIARPSDDSLFESLKKDVPNFSMRMSGLTAAVLRPQLADVDKKVSEYNDRYNKLVRHLTHLDCIEIPPPLSKAIRAGDSLQFNMTGLNMRQTEEFIKAASERGIKIQIFGRGDNARYFRNWLYSFEEFPDLSQTEEIISSACDIRLPLSFNADDINQIGWIIKDILYNLLRRKNRPDYEKGLTDSFSGIDEVVAKYDRWTSDYDREHQENGWKILLNHTVYTIADQLPGNAEILDVGCGTGLLGRELYAYGFESLHGIDISQKSLEVARQLDVYKAVHRGELGQPLDFLDSSFDALISCGVFTRKQVPVNAFEELIRILKPGGILAVVLRVEDGGYYEGKLLEYCSAEMLTEVLRKRLEVLTSCRHDLLVLKKAL